MANINIDFEFFTDNGVFVVAALCLVLGFLAYGLGNRDLGGLFIAIGLVLAFVGIPEKKRRRRRR